MRSTLRLLAVLVLVLCLSPLTLAQNRPQCLPTATGPGSCFIDNEVFGGIVFSGVDPDADYWRAVIPSSADDFFIFRPNGTVSTHLTDGDATFTVCPATAPASCADDGQGALTGEGRIQINAFLAVGGIVICPATISATASLIDGQSDYDMTYSLVTVRDGTACRTLLDDLRVTPAN